MILYTDLLELPLLTASPHGLKNKVLLLISNNRIIKCSDLLEYTRFILNPFFTILSIVYQKSSTFGSRRFHNSNQHTDEKIDRFQVIYLRS
jgi:hypothetical protein